MPGTRCNSEAEALFRSTGAEGATFLPDSALFFVFAGAVCAWAPTVQSATTIINKKLRRAILIQITSGANLPHANLWHGHLLLKRKRVERVARADNNVLLTVQDVRLRSIADIVG